MFIGLHIKRPLLLSHFNEKWIFPEDFSKNTPNTKFHKNPSSGSRVVPHGRRDGQTDTMKLIVSRFFCNFANGPKITSQFSVIFTWDFSYAYFYTSLFLYSQGAFSRLIWRNACLWPLGVSLSSLFSAVAMLLYSWRGGWWHCMQLSTECVVPSSCGAGHDIFCPCQNNTITYSQVYRPSAEGKICFYTKYVYALKSTDSVLPAPLT